MRIRMLAGAFILGTFGILTAAPAMAQPMPQPAPKPIFIDLHPGPKAKEQFDRIKRDLITAAENKNCYAWRIARGELDEFIAVRTGVGDTQGARIATALRDRLPNDPCDPKKDGVEYNRICDIDDFFFYYIPPPEDPRCRVPRIRVSMSTGYNSKEIGSKSGFGTIVTTGDPFLAASPERLDGWSVSTGLDFAAGGLHHSVSVSYSQADGDDSSGPSSVEAGYVSQSTANGSGWSIVSDVAASTDVKLKDFSLKYQAMGEFTINDGFAWGTPDDAWLRKSRKEGGIVLTLRSQQLDQNGHVQYDPVPTFSYADVSQSLDSFEIGAGPVIGGRRMLGDGLYISGTLSLQGVLRYSELESLEENCGNCGGTSILDEIDEDETSFDYRAGIEATIGYQFKGIDLGITAGADLYGRDIIDVRRNPDDESTQIGRDDAVDWGVLGKARFSF